LGIHSGRVDGQAEGPAPGRRGAGPSARARGRQYIVVWRWPSAEKPDAETDAPTPAETATSPASTCSPREPGAACRPRAKPAEPACPPARASSSASASSAVSTWGARFMARSEEHTSELQSRENLVCRLLLEKKKTRYCD